MTNGSANEMLAIVLDFDHAFDTICQMPNETNAHAIQPQSPETLNLSPVQRQHKDS